MVEELARMERMRAWLDAVCAELRIDPAVLDETTDDLLDLIRDVAHGPSRPGAPLTAFLVGLAAGSASPGLDPTQRTADRVAAVKSLVASWESR